MIPRACLTDETSSRNARDACDGSRDGYDAPASPVRLGVRKRNQALAQRPDANDDATRVVEYGSCFVWGMTLMRRRRDDLKENYSASCVEMANYVSDMIRDYFATMVTTIAENMTRGLCAS